MQNARYNPHSHLTSKKNTIQVVTNCRYQGDKVRRTEKQVAFCGCGVISILQYFIQQVVYSVIRRNV